MATRTASRSASAEREHHRTNLWAQLARFVGLFLSPGIGLFGAWLIHIWVSGIHIHWGRIRWDASPSPAAVTVAVCLVTLLTVGIAYLAWQFADHRKSALRGALSGSVVAVGVLFAINVGTGPSYAWSPLFVFTSWAVAVVWSIARLDVTRNDKQVEDKAEDTFLEKVGLKGWRGKGKPVFDEKGERLATEVEFEHAPGDTVDQLQEAVPAFESVSGSPAGFSRATGAEGRADRSTLTVLHKDPLVERAPLPEPSSPGGSVADGLMIGTYANGMKVMVFIGGPSSRLPDGPASPSNVVIMGMTRAGKTVAENEMMTEMGTRRDVVILYLNKSKGMQDLRPVSPIVEVAVIESDDDAGSTRYRDALTRVQQIMRYRQQQLGRFGISAWTAESCFHNPPWRTEGGKRVRMEPMPFLYVHIGEADAIVSLSGDGERAKNIASKCLSLGVAAGLSLQRADHMSMPTGLRFNLGTALCFGCSDDESPRFTLSAPTIKAGAHPENWGQRKPGYFYVESPGVDEKMFPVAARTFSDEDKDVLTDKLLRRNLEWCSRMARLDSGSVAATAYQDDKGKTHVWWTDMVTETDRVRAELLGRPAEPSASPGRVADDVQAYAPPANPQDDDDFADDDDEREREEMARELRETTHVEGIELYPRDPQTGDRARFEDATAPVPKAGPADQFTWDDPKPGPRDRAAAIEGVCRAALRLLERADVQDPTDARSVIVDIGMFMEEYPYRSRPFFSELLGAYAAGREAPLFGLTISAAPDLGADKARYRISRAPRSDHPA